MHAIFQSIEEGLPTTYECKKALAKLKEYLTKPPLLSPLVMGEKLYLYLAVSNIVVSSVLIREEGSV